MTLVAGVDSSTQSTKVEVRDVETGIVVGSGRAPHPPTDAAGLGAGPAGLVGRARPWRGPRRGTQPTSPRSRSPRSSTGSSSPTPRARRCGRRSSGTTPSRRPTPAGCSGSSTAVPRRGPTACGSVPVAAFTIAKLSWLHRSEPDVFGRMERVMLPHDWLAWRLTGEYGTDRGDASGTGYWSPAAGAYRTDLLEIVDRELDWAAMLPPVLAPELAHGTGDNMAAALGLGLRPGDVAISLGTSGTVFAVSDTPTADADRRGRRLRRRHRPVPPARLHAQRDEGHRRGRPVARRRRSPGSTRWPSRRRSARTAPPCSRTSTVSARRTDPTRAACSPACAPRRVVTTSHAPRSKGWCAVCSTASTRSIAAGVPTGGRLFVIGGGARSLAYPQIVADLAQRPVTVVATRRARRARRVRPGRGPCDRSPDRRGAGRVGPRAGHEIEPGARGRRRRPTVAPAYATARDLDLD